MDERTDVKNLESLIERLNTGSVPCQEASLLSKEEYIPCGHPSVALVKNRDITPYFMCFGCADHNRKNRGATILARISNPELDKPWIPPTSLAVGRSLAELADWLLQWKQAKSTAEEAVKKANEKVHELEQSMYAKMQEEEIDKFGHAGFLFYPYTESYPSAEKGREEEYFAWLEEHGEAGIIKRTIHPQTHRSWYKVHGEEYGEELTEKGLVKVFEQVRIGVRSQK